MQATSWYFNQKIRCRRGVRLPAGHVLCSGISQAQCTGNVLASRRLFSRIPTVASKKQMRDELPVNWVGHNSAGEEHVSMSFEEHASNYVRME
jgi:hypothetical protein